MAQPQQPHARHIARNKDGKPIAYAKTQWIPGEGMVEYAAPDGFASEDPAADADDTLAAAQRWNTLIEYFTGRAIDAMPANVERIQRARDIVLAGLVEPLQDGKHFKVKSQTHEEFAYTVNAACNCPDTSQAWNAWCKHKLAVAIWKRAHAAMEQPDFPPADAPVRDPLPEPTAPTDRPTDELDILSRYTWQRGDTIAIRYVGLLLLAKQRGLVTLQATWTHNDAELSLAVATAKFRDGSVWQESGDATPSNVTNMVKPHFRRMALTRAKARCLRDALGVDMVALEELGDA